MTLDELIYTIGLKQLHIEALSRELDALKKHHQAEQHQSALEQNERS